MFSSNKLRALYYKKTICVGYEKARTPEVSALSVRHSVPVLAGSSVLVLQGV